MNKNIGFGIVIFFCLCLLGSALLLSSNQGEQSDVKSKSQVVIKGTKPKAVSTNGFMQPHKALYEISMVSSNSGSQIINISGNMYFEWNQTCDAWLTDHRFNLTYEYSDAPAMRITSDFSTWESLDGRDFNFSSRRSRDGELYEEIRGSAERYEDGDGKALYTMPEGLEFDLPEGFVFPMQHTEMVAQALKNKNQRFLNKVLFDGSDVDGPIEVNAFVGKQANAIARLDPNEKIDFGLLNAHARDVQMAFFPLIDEELFAADYEMDALFHENSIISDMYIDYEEFSIRQKLVALEKLDISTKCDKN